MAVAEKVMGLPGRANGLAPIYVDPATGALAGGLMTLGARGDSYYEYLLKQWLLGGKRQPALLQCAPPTQCPSRGALLARFPLLQDKQGSLEEGVKPPSTSTQGTPSAHSATTSALESLGLIGWRTCTLLDMARGEPRVRGNVGLSGGTRRRCGACASACCTARCPGARAPAWHTWASCTAACLCTRWTTWSASCRVRFCLWHRTPHLVHGVSSAPPLTNIYPCRLLRPAGAGTSARRQHSAPGRAERPGPGAGPHGDVQRAVPPHAGRAGARDRFLHAARRRRLPQAPRRRHWRRRLHHQAAGA